MVGRCFLPSPLERVCVCLCAPLRMTTQQSVECTRVSIRRVLWTCRCVGGTFGGGLSRWSAAEETEPSTPAATARRRRRCSRLTASLDRPRGWNGSQPASFFLFLPFTLTALSLSRPSACLETGAFLQVPLDGVSRGKRGVLWHGLSWSSSLSSVLLLWKFPAVTATRPNTRPCPVWGLCVCLAVCTEPQYIFERNASLFGWLFGERSTWSAAEVVLRDWTRFGTWSACC